MFDDDSRYFPLKCLQMRPLMDAAQLAEQTRYMPSTSAMFSFDQTPYLRVPTAALSDLGGTCGVVIKSCAQVGKQLKWSTPIPTPSGMKTMEELKEGDLVFSMDGTQTRIVFKTPPQYTRMYRVCFDDGTYLDAGAEHLWLVSEIDSSGLRSPEKVVSTQEMVDTIERKSAKRSFWSKGKLRSIFSIRMPDPVQCEEKDLPIDPYTLGCWLGDGYENGGYIYKPEADLREMFPEYRDRIRSTGKNRTCRKLTIPGLTQALRLNGLTRFKHIPEIYFRASVEQRLALLQGLMDTDGTSQRKSDSRAEWCQKSERLTKDMLRLLSSLGIKVSCHKRKKRIKNLGFEGEYYFISFSTDLPVFRLKRKAERMSPTVRKDAHWRYIRDIKPIPTERSYCIAVDHPSHTYLAGDQYCVTHNTTVIENFLSWIVEYDKANTMIILDTQKSAERLSRGRIRPFLRMRGINNTENFARNKNADQSNSVVNIGLGAGANLFLCSSKSPSDLRSTPVKYLFCDEADAWPDALTQDDGDPLQNALQRMMRYRGMYLITSTPTTPEGRITKNFAIGTQESWGVMCNCGAFMDVKWDDIDFTGSTPTYHCKVCGEVYTEEGIKALHHCYGEPQNKAPLKDQYGRILRSFQIPGTLVHFFYTWKYLKELELASLALGESSYQSFRNTRLGETYTPKDEVEIDTIELARRCQAYHEPDCLPQDVIGITIGVDTHDSCLYAFTAAFTADSKDIYGLSYKMLVGSPSKNEVWEALRELLNTQYTRYDGLKLYPSMLFIDSGGHHTNDVYRCTYSEPRMMPIKGFSTDKVNAQDPLIGQLKKVKMGGGIKASTKLLFLGVNAGKDFLQNRIILTMSGEQRLFYPKGHGFDVEYFKGLLSERKIEGKWRAKVHTHNEPLDCFVYALAAFQYWEMKFYRTGKDIEYMKALQDLANTQNTENIENEENKSIKHVEESVEPVQPKKKAPAW